MYLLDSMSQCIARQKLGAAPSIHQESKDQGGAECEQCTINVKEIFLSGPLLGVMYCFRELGRALC